MFALFDPDDDFVVRRGRLPHWFQPGITYFITFRTTDSIPADLLRSWHLRRDDWFRRRDIDPRSSDWRAAFDERPELEREYHLVFSRPFMEYLDRGRGACPLSDTRLARLVAESLHHGDGTRYWLGAFVAMPNHVHVLVCLIGRTELAAQCRSWKKFSATAINRALGSRGRFWQSESFDHAVRSPEQFAYLQQYIAQNPKKARLAPGSYLHYQPR
ncbi:MAG: hypothetical protein DWQ37_03620 [Planctomycetota bacterium]|nr:MAG: hypothetical protein DWQ37_03620 [Planctomycetota bacterium]